MKATSALALGSFLAALGLSGHGTAFALPTTESASICMPWGEFSGPGLARSTTGLHNTRSAPLSVLCPLVRTGGPTSAGFVAHVNGRQPAGTTLSCRFVSLRRDSFALQSSAFVLEAPPTPGGIVRMRGTLTVVPPGSYQTVLCTIPPGGKLFSIESAQ